MNNLSSKKLYFPRRIPEPKTMGSKEMAVFQKLSSNNLNRWNLPLLEQLESFSKKGPQEILDVSCGPGIFSKTIAKYHPKWKITGIDISKVAVKMARKNCAGLKNVKIKLTDVYKLPFPREKFDLIICKDSLHHFNRLSRALSEIIRVLKQKSVLIIQDIRRDLPNYLLMRAYPPDTILKKLQFYSARAAYTKSELKKILQRLPINSFSISTSTRISSRLQKSIKKYNISPKELKEGLQARFLLLIRK